MILATEYPLSRVAELLEVKPRTLQSWVQFMATDSVEGGGAKGIHRRFSFNAVMHIATASKLMGLGVTASRAFEYAAKFSHTGSGGSGWTGGLKSPAQLPGLPFHTVFGKTYLCADATQAVVVRVPKGGNFDAILEDRKRGYSDLDKSALTRIDVWPVFCEVVRGLTGDISAPFDLLNEVYGIHSEADLQEYEAD